MAKSPPRYVTKAGDSPPWASEPFRVFFPLGIAAALFGLLLWPLHYAGWWELYPALQHPRILIFGFGAAFVFGFLGTAWPRFLEAEALRVWEVGTLIAGWIVAQLAYARGSIAVGDLLGGITCLVFLFVLGRRLFGEKREIPPPGFALAFFSVALASATLFAWSAGLGEYSVQVSLLLRLFAYQGFLLLPILGVGSYLFARFFQVAGAPPAFGNGRHRGLFVWGAAGLILVSFFIEAYLSARWGNMIRFGAMMLWAWGALPGIWAVKAPGTRAWALRFGLILLALAFLCRVIWPSPLFAFQHFLFLGGFCQVILLTADRVILGHCDDLAGVLPKSRAWQWMVWLMVLTAATRATADLVPSTRVSHHIYAALMLVTILMIWMGLHLKRLRHIPPGE